jgi:thiol-disulfide isomerase/thioredoxin
MVSKTARFYLWLSSAPGLSGKRTMKCLVNFLLPALILLSGSLSQTPAQAADSSESRQKAEAVLGRVSEFYRQLKSFSCEIVSQQSIKVNAVDGRNLDINTTFDVSMQRPNQLSIVQTSGAPALDEKCDGRDNVVFSPAQKKYLLHPAGATAQIVFRDPDFRGVFGLLRTSCLDVLLAETPQLWGAFSLGRGGGELSYAGEAMLDGTAVDRVSITGPRWTQLVSVEKGLQPWVRQVSFQDESMAVEPAAKVVAFMAETRVNRPLANPDLRQDRFKFVPPEGSQKVENLSGGEPVSPLVGKAALDFTGNQLSGKPVTLSKFKNKKIVMLDFWATWCPPCRRAMPLVLQVADKYRRKGLVFFSINEKEPEAKVEQFMKKNNLSMSVVLDPDGAIGNLYKVEGIPTTVIIDRQGVVRVVHTGYNVRLAEELSREIDSLLETARKR